MSERYDTFLQVRLTTHDKERIKARALEAGLKTSEYVRKRALGPHKQYEVHVPPESFKRLLEREAEASVALDGETMYEGHPSVAAKMADETPPSVLDHPAVVEARESAELDASGAAGETLTPEKAHRRKRDGRAQHPW